MHKKLGKRASDSTLNVAQGLGSAGKSGLAGVETVGSKVVHCAESAGGSAVQLVANPNATAGKVCARVSKVGGAVAHCYYSCIRR